jgi:FkbM family methyltransferase
MAFDKVGPNGQVICFEPNRVNYKILNKNIDLNQAKNILAYNIGLNNESGFYNFSGEDVSSKLILNKKNDENLNYVECKTLDSILKNSVVYDIIKIDTEGNKLNILKGAINLIRNNQLPILVLEVNGQNDYYNIASEHIKEFLIKNDYLFGTYCHKHRELKLDNKLYEDTIAVKKSHISKLNQINIIN